MGNCCSSPTFTSGYWEKRQDSNDPTIELYSDQREFYCFTLKKETYCLCNQLIVWEINQFEQKTEEDENGMINLFVKTNRCIPCCCCASKTIWRKTPEAMQKDRDASIIEQEKKQKEIENRLYFEQVTME